MKPDIQGDGEATDAVPTLQFDEEKLAAIVAATTKALLDKEAPVQEKREVPINPEAGETEKAKVTGERVPQWERRAFRYINACVDLSSADDESARNDARGRIGNLTRMAEDMTDWQKGEEDKEAEEIIRDSGLSRRVQKRLHSTLTGPAGEFLLPKPFLAEVFVIIEEFGVARQILRMVPMVSKDLDLKNVATKPTVVWTGEGADFTESDVVHSEQKLITNKLAAITSWTTEQDEDQAIALLPIYSELIGEDMAKKEDEAAFLGDGTSTYGGFTGLTNLASANTTTMATGLLAISDVTETHLRSVLKSLTQSSRTGGSWLIHYDTWDHITTLENTAGNRVVQITIDGTPALRLLGYPVVLSEAMNNPAGDLANTELAVFGRMNRSLMGVRRGMSIDTSREAILADSNGVVIYNAYQADGQLMRISERIAFQTPTANQAGFGVLVTAAS